MDNNNNAVINQIPILPPTSSPQYEIKNPKLEASEWARCCELLLKELEHESPPESFRFEVKFLQHETRMLLSVDPCYWYCYILDKTTRLEVARKWVDSTRALRKAHVSKLLKTDPDQGEVVEVDKYCEFGPNCKYGERCYKRHSKIHCTEQIEKRDQSVEHCGFHAFDELLIEELGKQEEFIVMTKLKADRELLVLPYPQHCTNRQLIVKETFWKFLFDLKKRLCADDPQAVEYVACNFGEWETKSSQDSLAKECHAHVHIGLSANAQKNLAKKYEQLNQRLLDPADYSIDNIDYLERHYLLPEENRQLRADLQLLLKNATKQQ